MTNFANFSLFFAFLAIFSCVYSVSGKEVVYKSAAVPTCPLCEFAMKELEELLSENSTVQEIETALDKLCSFLPTTLQDECTQLVADYTDEIITLLVNGVTPEQICKELGACTSSISGKSAIPGPQCELCKMVVSKLTDMISSKSTKAEIKAALEKVCSLLPSSASKDCDDFVEKYGDMIITFIAQDLGPEAICAAIQLCSSPKPPLKLPVRAEAGNCALCEFVMKELDSQLTQNATEAEITKLVENICTVLPGTLNAECKSFLDTYGPVLIQLLVSDLIEPKTFCTFVGLCSTKDTAVFKPKPAVGQVKANPGECALCEFFMKEVEQLLSENSTEEEIKNILEKGCSLLPQSLQTSCKLDINKYLDAILQLLINGIHPSQICSVIGLCEAVTASFDDDCQLCQILMVVLDEYILSNRTEKEIYEDFEEACALFTGALNKECLDFVHEYGHEIPDLLEQLLAPLKVCQALGVCKASTESDMCSKGPAAWCSSMENAKLCNAVVHCQRHVWN